MTNTDTERLARDLIEHRENLTRLQRELFQSLPYVSISKGCTP